MDIFRRAGIRFGDNQGWTYCSTTFVGSMLRRHLGDGATTDVRGRPFKKYTKAEVILPDGTRLYVKRRA